MSLRTEIEQAALALREGKLVIFPTETVYGLGANALEAKACAAIFEAKGRPQFNPLIVHIADSSRIEPLTALVPPKARQLMEKFWPGPLTVVLPKSVAIPDIVTAGLPSVALRVPNHPLALELLKAVDFPLAAPSANRFQGLSPTEAKHISDKIRERATCLIDGGKCGVGIESTIVGFQGNEVYCLRLGGLSIEAIEAVIGGLIPSPKSESPMAPGMLAKHYSPEKRLLLWNGVYPSDPSRFAFLAFQTPPSTVKFKHIECLSAHGNMVEAASHLFSKLQKLDSFEVDGIYAELVPDSGLGRAINDRLRRAAFGNRGFSQ